MKEVLLKVYSFDELDDRAKQEARSWWVQNMEFAWCDESIESIKAFCDYFSVRLINYSVDDVRFDYQTNETNANFRGMKLADFDRDYTPTGYCLDYALWQTFYDVFKATGDAKRAFDEGLYKGFQSWRDDMAMQLSDECVDECLAINDYEFMEDGSRARY